MVCASASASSRVRTIMQSKSALFWKRLRKNSGSGSNWTMASRAFAVTPTTSFQSQARVGRDRSSEHNVVRCSYVFHSRQCTYVRKDLLQTRDLAGRPAVRLLFAQDRRLRQVEG